MFVQNHNEIVKLFHLSRSNTTTNRQEMRPKRRFPPVSYTVKLKSDTQASKETSGGQRGHSLATEKKQTQSTKPNLEWKKLQLTYRENSKEDLQPARLPPIHGSL